MSHIAPPTLEDQTRALHGVDAIAAYLGINHVLTQLFLETETLRGTKTDDGWATAPTLPAAMQCIEAWDFKYVSQMCWDKVRPGLGYWARNQHELLLIATKGSFPAPDGKLRKASLQSIEKGEHSVKPPEFRTIIEEMFPMYARQTPPLMLELFGRGSAPLGWEFYGYEVSEDGKAA